MILKSYMTWETIWFWGPTHGWRPGNVINCGRNRVTIRYSLGEETYRIYHMTACRVRPRDRSAEEFEHPPESPFEFEPCP